MHLSVVAPSVPARPHEWDAVADLVAASSLHRLWAGQSYGVDSMAMMARLTGRGVAIRCGTSVSVAPLTDPRRAAGEARSIAAMTGHDFVHGVGPGSRGVQRLIDEERRPMALDDLRRYAEVFRTELDAECPGLLEPIVTPSVDLGLGVLRPGAAALAGEIADAYITWMTTAEHLADTLVPAVVDSAHTHRRAVPRGVAMVAMALDRPGRDRYALAHLAVGGHIRSPHYRDAVRRAGIEVVDDYGRTIDNLMRHGLFLYGDADEMADRLHRTYGTCGVDEVALMMVATTNLHGLDAMREDLIEIADAFARRTAPVRETENAL